MSKSPVLLDPAHPDAPKYWMWETSGRLGPAIEAYLNRREMTVSQMNLMRAYLRQWIDSPVWERNPAADKATLAELQHLRATIRLAQSRKDLSIWLRRALESGHDPL